MDPRSGGRIVLAAILVLAAFGPGLAGSADKGLYRAVTVVTGTVEPERSRGFAACLRQVLTRLAGDPALAESTQVAEAAARAADFVGDFHYRDRMAGLPVHDEQGTRERPHLLTVAFVPERIDALLESLGRTAWRDRPVVLLDIEVDNGERRFVLEEGGSTGRDHRAALLETADRFGLTVRFPVRGDRAGGNPVLSGRLAWRSEAFEWSSGWHLESLAGSEEWRFSAASFDAVFRDALERTLVRLAAGARR